MSQNTQLNGQNTQLNGGNIYSKLFNVFNGLNTNKVNEVKNEIGKFICNIQQIEEIENYKFTHNLPIYLDYIFVQLIKSFPIIKRAINQMISQAKQLDESNIHPYMFVPFFTNIVQSAYIDFIIDDLSNNSGANINDKLFDDIIKISPEVSLLFDQFNPIFDSIDEKYLSAENNLGFNNMMGLSDVDFDKIFSNIAIGQNMSIQPRQTLNAFIVQLQRMSQINVEQSIQSLQISLNDIIERKPIQLFADLNDNQLNQLSQSNKLNKLSFDNNLFQHILKIYSNFLKENYLRIKFFDVFEEINILDELNKLNNNALYFWIDYVAVINNSLFETLLKTKQSK